MSASDRLPAIARIDGWLRSPLLYSLQRADEIRLVLAAEARHAIDLGKRGAPALDAVAALAHLRLFAALRRIAGGRRGGRRRRLGGGRCSAAARIAGKQNGSDHRTDSSLRSRSGRPVARRAKPRILVAGMHGGQTNAPAFSADDPTRNANRNTRPTREPPLIAATVRACPGRPSTRRHPAARACAR